MNELLPVILGSGAISGIAVAIITALFNRRRIKAETTSLITAAAGGIVQNLQDDNVRLRGEVAKAEFREVRRKKAEKERDKEFRLQLQAHREHDLRIVEALRGAGIAIDDPPLLDFRDYEWDEELPTE